MRVSGGMTCAKQVKMDENLPVNTGDIEVECQKCHERWWVWDDPAGVGAGYPYGWQYIVHEKCGGIAVPIEKDKKKE